MEVREKKIIKEHPEKSAMSRRRTLKGAFLCFEVFFNSETHLFCKWFSLLGKKIIEFRRGDGRAEVIALAHVATEKMQDVPLLLGLNAFRDGLEIRSRDSSVKRGRAPGPVPTAVPSCKLRLNKTEV